MGVIPSGSAISHVRRVYCDAARFLLWRLVDLVVGHVVGESLSGQVLCDGSGECGFAVIHMANCSDVDVHPCLVVLGIAAIKDA